MQVDNFEEHANVNIDMRRNLKLLDKDFSINMLYIRNNNFVRCSCWDITEKCGDPKCPKCFGMGYFASIQKIQAIESSTSPYTPKSQTQPTAVGAVNYKEEVYYLDYTIKPKQRDFLIKTTWKNDLPVDIIQVLEISNVYEMRGDNGRVEVYGAHITNRPDLVKDFNTTIKKFPQKAFKVLQKGDRYLWPKILLP